MMAGAYYGIDKDLLSLYKVITKWDNLNFAVKAYKLYNKIPVNNVY